VDHSQSLSHLSQGFRTDKGLARTRQVSGACGSKENIHGWQVQLNPSFAGETAPRVKSPTSGDRAPCRMAGVTVHGASLQQRSDFTQDTSCWARERPLSTPGTRETFIEEEHDPRPPTQRTSKGIRITPDRSDPEPYGGTSPIRKRPPP
jgi:hypothetical protein